jgi:hypothetical protein
MPGPFNNPPNTVFKHVPMQAQFECNHKLWRRTGVFTAVNCYSPADIADLPTDLPVYYAEPTVIEPRLSITAPEVPEGWNPMSTNPDKPGAYEMALKGGAHGGLFSRWDGYQWHVTCGNAPSALACNSRSEDAYDGTLVGWRELADKVSASSEPNTNDMFGATRVPRAEDTGFAALRDDDPVHVLPEIESVEFTRTSMTEEISFGWRFKAGGNIVCELVAGTIQPNTPSTRAIEHYVQRMREFKPVAQAVLDTLDKKEITS